MTVRVAIRFSYNCMTLTDGLGCFTAPVNANVIVCFLLDIFAGFEC